MKKLGEVELVRSGAKCTILHGYGQAKIAAIPAIKTVIEKGDIISYTPNYTDYYDRYVIAGKGTIDGNPTILGVVINSYNTDGKNKFYLHEAEIIKAEPSSMTGLPNGKDTVNDSASNTNIPNSAANVKQKQLDIILESNPAPNTYHISKVYIPPVEMLEKWEREHKIYVEKVAWIKQMLAM